MMAGRFRPPAPVALVFLAAALLLGPVLATGCSGDGDTATTAANTGGSDTTLADTSGTGDAAATTQTTTVSGKILFDRECAGCHGVDGRAKFAPTVVGVDAATVDEVIREGTGDMTGFGERFSDEERAAIVEHVGTLE